MPAIEPDKPLPIDHLVVLARELDRAIADLEQRLDVRAAIGGRHPAFGTHNALLSLRDDCYLELIAPDPDAGRTQATRRWPFIPAEWSRGPPNEEEQARGGIEDWSPRAEQGQPLPLREPCYQLINFAVRVDNIEQHVERARSHGFDPGEVMPMSRDQPNGVRLNWTLTLRETVAGDGLVPFLIEWGDSPHPARSCPPGCRLLELHGEHPDPPAVQRNLAALGVNMVVRRGPRPALVAEIDSPRGRIELR